MALTLKLRARSSVPIDLEGVVPDRLVARSLAEIERLLVCHGNRIVPLADLFDVGGDPSDERMIIEGDLDGVHSIGRGLRAGDIFIKGNAGRHVGAEMRGGTIEVEGDAGDHVGCEMHGGKIQVGGRAGNRVGAAYPGGKRGMTDGMIVIRGDVGSEIGVSMRRGTIVVGGSCADAPGFDMIAGTILVFGNCGQRPGAGMRRGTIGLFGDVTTALLPTFRAGGRFRPLFLRLLLRELRNLDFAFDHGLADAELSLFHGDLVSLGKGEIWMKSN